MKKASCSKTLLYNQKTTWRNKPEDCRLNSHGYENLQRHNLTLVCAVIINDHASLLMAVVWDDRIQFLADALQIFHLLAYHNIVITEDRCL